MIPTAGYCSWMAAQPSHWARVIDYLFKFKIDLFCQSPHEKHACDLKRIHYNDKGKCQAAFDKSQSRIVYSDLMGWRRCFCVHLSHDGFIWHFYEAFKPRCFVSDDEYGFVNTIVALITQSKMWAVSHKRWLVLILCLTNINLQDVSQSDCVKKLLGNGGTAPIDLDQSKARGQISDLVPECLGPDRQRRGQMRQCQYWNRLMG